MMDVAVAGHPESSDLASEAVREIAEEMGITVLREQLVPAGSRIRKNGSDHEYVSLYLLDVSGSEHTLAANYGAAISELHVVRVSDLHRSPIPSQRLARFSQMVFESAGAVSSEAFVDGVLEEVQHVLAVGTQPSLF